MVAGTAGSAAACGLADHIGSIVPGRVADLVVVDGDPLDDPELLLDEARIWLVFQAGGAVAGAGLDSDLASLRSAVPGTDPVPALAGRPVG
jgi:imidazolonepropionase-like amidohydrolase